MKKYILLPFSQYQKEAEAPPQQPTTTTSTTLEVSGYRPKADTVLLRDTDIKPKSVAIDDIEARQTLCGKDTISKKDNATNTELSKSEAGRGDGPSDARVKGNLQSDISKEQVTRTGDSAATASTSTTTTSGAPLSDSDTQTDSERITTKNLETDSRTDKHIVSSDRSNPKKEFKKRKHEEEDQDSQQDYGIAPAKPVKKPGKYWLRN